MQVAKEDREVGNISFKIYWKYFVNGASAFVLILMALVFAWGQGKIIITISLRWFIFIVIFLKGFFFSCNLVTN